MKFTIEQQLAIDKEGSNIIVSAGAGSGKTAVLTARVLRKLKSGVDIRNILILTFTNEAAKEMKKRIRDGIIKEGLTEQLEYIDTAYITTFDAYALGLVKKYHYLFNMSKDITIVDESIINMIKKQFLDDIFMNYYEKKEPRFLNLIDTFTVRDDNLIKQAIFNMSSCLDLKYDKKEYLSNYIDNYFNNIYLNNLFNEYFNYLKNICLDIETNYYLLSNYVDEGISLKLEQVIKPMLNPNSYDDLKNISNWKLPIIRNLEEEAKIIKDNLKSAIDELKDSVIYSKKEIIEQLNSTKDYVAIIIDIMLELDNKISNYKREKEAFEFIDISKMAIKLVNENEKIKNKLKYNLNEIMIDEYQDTNDLQEIFISKIENNNVYMVGDIKQSIYRFRNANPKIFKDKYNKFKNGDNGLAIDLVKNFRSREEVLNNINEIFNLIMTKDIGDVNYQDNHEMVYGNTSYIEKGFTNNNYNMDILCYDETIKDFTSREIEAFTIVKDIKEKINNKYQVYDFKTGLRDIRYDDFCIILDRGTDMSFYKKVFEYFNIPMQVYKDDSLTNDIEIILIKNIIGLILKIKNKEYDTKMRYYFTSIARSFLFGLSDECLFECLKDSSFYNTKVYQICFSIAKNVKDITPNILLNNILEEFNFYENLIKIGDINRSLIRIDYLLDLSLCVEKLGFTIEDFYNFLTNMIDENKDIRYKDDNTSNNCVKIMNIHKSKGLEFPICYFAGFKATFNFREINAKFIYEDTYGFLTPYFNEGIGNLITKTLIKNKYYQEEISEKIRLFYVALTRAKEKIIIVLPNFKEKKLVKKQISYNIGIKYRSFYDFISSISLNLNKYIKQIDINSLDLTHEYEYISINNNLNNYKSNMIMEFRSINILYNEIKKNNASKKIKKFLTKEDVKKLELGTSIHQLLEFTDFKNVKTNNIYINNLINTFDFKNATIYQELEFIFKDTDKEYHGIIDLMLEYENFIQIIDYKLKDITDKEYLKQLEIYYKYVKSISNKKVYLYLYSLINNEIKEISITV